jgi:hypothetical protein
VVLTYSLLCALGSCESPTHRARQQQFDANLQQAVEHFRSGQRSDTLNFARLVATPWDSLYVFWQIGSMEWVTQRYPSINWHSTIWQANPAEAGDVGISRLVFVYQGDAIEYLDVHTPLDDQLHLQHYPRFLAGDAFTRDAFSTKEYKPDKLLSDPLPDFCFSRAQARFVLVGRIQLAKPDLPNRGVKIWKYVPLAYVQQHAPRLDTVLTSCPLSLHSVTGCGLANCLTTPLASAKSVHKTLGGALPPAPPSAQTFLTQKKTGSWASKRVSKTRN